MTEAFVRDLSPAPYASSLSESDKETIERALAILSNRYTMTEAINDPRVAGAFIALKLGGCEREVFGAMFLDTRHRLISWKELFFGSIDGAEVHPREVVREALNLNAAAVILGHNHPSGVPEPSAADRAVTARMKQALSLVDIRLLDHFIVSGGLSTSMATRGWI